MLHSSSSTCGPNMNPYGQFQCQNSDFYKSWLVPTKPLKLKSPFDSKPYPYDMRMNEAHSCFCKFNFVYQNQEKINCQMFVIHIDGTNLKTVLLQILETNMIFSSKLGGIHFFFYLQAKYELIWTDFIAQTMM